MLADCCPLPIMVRPYWSDRIGQTVLDYPHRSDLTAKHRIYREFREGMNASKAEEITRILRTEILRGQYREGERLPSERDLAARFEANRGAVREAIKKLEQLGIVDVQAGGIRIVAVEDATLEVLGHIMDLEEIPSPTLVMQIFEVIGAIMAQSAGSAIRNATTEQITGMRSILKKLLSYTDRHEEYHAEWQTLGACFSEVNQNLVLRLIINGLKTQFVERLRSAGLHPQIDDKKDTEYLLAIDAALENRDLKAASEAIIGHFQLLNEGLVAALEERQEAGVRSVSNA
ncbi:MAG: hypothetical protein CMQ19_13515 [Gammaproteobacteria bacterium]|nr:hypothetical protein [Gammaproteobacteria bacterium]